MIRLLGLVRKREDLDFDAFQRHWGTVHRDLMLQIRAPSPLVGYVQNVRIDPDVDGLASDWDGAWELWITDEAGLERMGDDPSYREALEVDSPRFVTLENCTRFRFEESDVPCAAAGDAPSPSTRLLCFFERPVDPAAAARFDRAWTEARDPILFPGTAPRKLSRAVISEGNAGAGFSYYGFESTWWDSPEQVQAAARATTAPQVAARFQLLLSQPRTELAPPAEADTRAPTQGKPHDH